MAFPSRRFKRFLVGAFFIVGSIGGVLANCESIPVTRGYLDNFRGGFKMPPFAAVNRTLGLGTHAYLELLPGAAQSPAMQRVEPDLVKRQALLSKTKVRIAMLPDYAHIDDKAGEIVLAWWYYHLGADTHLYLDLLHELTHIRQLRDGADLWDSNFSYTKRPTEIEGYTVAIEEGRRLALPAQTLHEHLHFPMMTDSGVAALQQDIDALIARAPLNAGTPP